MHRSRKLEFIDRIGKQPVRKEFRTIEMLVQTTDKQIEIYDVVVENLSGNFHLRTEITKVNRGVPLNVTNPW